MNMSLGGFTKPVWALLALWVLVVAPASAAIKGLDTGVSDLPEASGSQTSVNRQKTVSASPSAKPGSNTLTIVAPGGKTIVVNAPAAAKSVAAPAAAVHASAVAPVEKKTLATKPAAKSRAAKVVAAEEKVAAASTALPVGQVEIATSLADLGYRNGFQFDGVQSIHDEAIFFPVPKDAEIVSGKIRLHYRSSPMLHKASNVRVYANHVPLVAVGLSGDGDQVLDIPVRKSELITKDGFVRVELKVSMLFSDDRCLDERINGGYFYVKPETSLTVTLRDEISSLRGAWSMLPQEVRVSLPAGPVSKEIFSAAWSLDEMLTRENKRVTFVRLPEVGDLVVASDSELQTSLHQSAAGSNVSLMRRAGGGRDAIVLSEPYDVTPFYLLSTKWRGLAAGTQYQIFPLEEGKIGGDEKYRMMLNDMGLNTETRYVDRLVEWNFVFSADKLPAGYAARSLDFDVTATPGSDEHPAMFYVYLNNVLQEAVRLQNDGKMHRISVDIPKEGLARHNAIRVVTQREYIEGDCHGDLPRFPVQIMPSSSMLVLRQAAAQPKEFLELGAYFREGFDTYLPTSYLQRPEQTLNMLTRLVIDQALLVDAKRLNFFEPNATLKPEKPFVVLGRPHLELDYQPVRFDKGHIQVLGENGAKLLDVDSLPGVGIAQIVRTGSVSGMWLAPGQEGAILAASSFQFDHDDVTFVDSSGVLLSLNSRQAGGVHIYYPGQRSWQQWVDEYRYWLLFAAWMVLTVILVYLFRRTRQTGGGSSSEE